MPDIFLLRHAHAESAAPGEDDAARSLSPLGKSQALAAAEWLKPKLHSPVVLVSTARRCQQTWQALQPMLAGITALDVASIYEASPGTLLQLLAQHRCEQIVLIGHNPGLEHTCALLHSGRSGEARGMPTAAVAHLKVSPGSQIEPGCAELLEFWWPG